MLTFVGNTGKMKDMEHLRALDLSGAHGAANPWPSPPKSTTVATGSRISFANSTYSTIVLGPMAKK